MCLRIRYYLMGLFNLYIDAVNLSPRDYARNNRRWRGAVPISSFERLAQELKTDCESVDVQLAFSLDEDGHIRMQGQATVAADVACHRCAEYVTTTICADIDARIVRTEERARDLLPEADVIVVTDNPVDVSELIEDDLIMSIPWRVCENQQVCENLVDDAKAVGLVETTQKPFANLRELLKR